MAAMKTGKDESMVEVHSETGGVQPMSIEGRMARERERLMGMTNEERAWRAQWLKDQILAEDEPRIPENYYKERYNPLRRFFRAPANALENMLVPVMGDFKAHIARHMITKTAMVIGCIYLTFYYFKYNQSDWTRQGGWKVMGSSTAVYPGMPGFPHVERKKHGHEFYSFGFENCPLKR